MRSRQRLLGLVVAAFFIPLVSTLRVSAPEASAPNWTPSVDDRWLYQIGDASPALTLCVAPFRQTTCVSPTVWVLDLYSDDSNLTTNGRAVRAVHRRGGHAVCYLSAGTSEAWRRDAIEFPAVIVGDEVSNWPGERWLDVRKRTILKPILSRRAKACKDSGFDAIDWDNVDGYTNDTGFAISERDQLAYNRMLADITHQLKMSVGLKNDVAQATELQPYFDFAVNEQCTKFQECDSLMSFSRARKAVVQIEYELKRELVCPAANRHNWAAMTMERELTARSWKPCR